MNQNVHFLYFLLFWSVCGVGLVCYFKNSKMNNGVCINLMRSIPAYQYYSLPSFGVTPNINVIPPGTFSTFFIPFSFQYQPQCCTEGLMTRMWVLTKICL